MNVSGSATATSSTSTSSSPSNVAKPAVQEFSIRVPKNTKKKFNVMRFNSNLNVDFTKWSQVKMERENNKVEKHPAEEMPKFGAGSEYRREEKEEARRRRLGYVPRNYNVDDQPWILKCGGKNGKKFRGIREGGVGENAAYYVFTHGSDGSIEAYPAAEWYNFQPIQRFKTLSAEEAELEFGKRNKSLNYFTLMKRFGKNEEEEKEEESSSRKKAARDLKISDMDDWIDSDEDDDMGSDENGSDDGGRKNKKKKPAQKKMVVKKKADKSDESAFEESDDGDEEGRELDYISDSSEDVSDHEAKVDQELKGVDEEDALRKLLNSDEEEEEEEEKENAEKKNEEGNKSDEEGHSPSEEISPPGSVTKKKRKKELSGKLNSSNVKNEDTSSEFSGDSSDSDSDKQQLKSGDVNFDAAQASTSAEFSGSSEQAAKRPRLDNNESTISEEAVRRYLMRKPMTAKELLQKFKKSKTNLSSEQLVNMVAQILKRINPITKTIGGQIKLFVSESPSAPSS